MADEIRALAPALRDDVTLRLKRIEGQVRGVQRMIEEGRDCRDIVTQVAAIRSALGSVNSIVLQCYAHNCLENADQPRDTTIAELIELFKGAR